MAQISAASDEFHRLVVIGAGVAGRHFATAMLTAGLDVLVIESGKRPEKGEGSMFPDEAIQWNRSVTGLTSTDDRGCHRLALSDGTAIVAGVVVGADGPDSVVRPLIAAPSATSWTTVPGLVLIGTAAHPSIDSHDMTVRDADELVRALLETRDPSAAIPTYEARLFQRIAAATSPNPVLVVGGSLVGLSAAMFLAWQNVPVIVVEKHAGSSPHPRAIGYTPRTMELFRAVGIGDRVPEAPADFRLIRARVASLAEEWFEQSSWSDGAKDNEAVYSPCRGAAIAQDRLEPILRARAVELGADIRTSVELIDFTQDATGVSATVRPRDGSAVSVIRASYMIAADGAKSAVREALGMSRSGRGPIRTVRSVLFRAPLEEYLARGVTQFEIDQPDLKAFLTTYQDGRWVLMFKDQIERDEEALQAAIRKAIGRDDLPIEIITTGVWELGALVADSFASGRVFLAGDSAHALPPTRGGYGANTGIADAHNLAWKLAAVLAGHADTALLDTYDAERRPVAWCRHQQIFVRPDYRRDAAGHAVDEPMIDDDAMEFGALYRSSAVIGTTDALPAALRPDQWAGQPGTRLPHLWVMREKRRVSTLDLLGTGWTVLTMDAAWPVPEGVARLLAGVDFIPEDVDTLRSALGLGRSGAMLVRPDGVIAVRFADLPQDPATVLRMAFESVSAAL
ncbi:FAD-dependent monooxygenase [Komagataeibacter sp. FNDCF1]|uniref:FAD-dependent monooxygenase n=1 Tax=Komagataeibacter sp. FNDCF1 TaxID=2878681 RepID=UPI001E562237|nr:FAD-dependent monooxygenase [Komagataeibacter sp. FNDCF1]MCE2564818.1 FAD-dependent monooxygenase [Komagataeibacter sp. FNDCF1]